MENCFGLLLLAGTAIFIITIMYAARQKYPASLPPEKPRLRPNNLTAFQPEQRRIQSSVQETWFSRYGDEAFEAWSYGSILDPIVPAAFGELSIHNTELLFIHAYSELHSLTIPLHTIRWLSHQNMSQAARDFGPLQEALTLHCESGGRWWIYSFSSPKAEQIAQRIKAQTQANYQLTYTIGGPIQVNSKIQDIYGQWVNQGKITLYLAPDRLLSTWQSWIELRQIQHLALLPDNTLKITYLADKLYVIGLDLDHDQAIIWGQRIERATGIAVENLTGRKKKSDGTEW